MKTRRRYIIARASTFCKAGRSHPTGRLPLFPSAWPPPDRWAAPSLSSIQPPARDSLLPKESLFLWLLLTGSRASCSRQVKLPHSKLCTVAQVLQNEPLGWLSKSRQKPPVRLPAHPPARPPTPTICTRTHLRGGRLSSRRMCGSEDFRDSACTTGVHEGRRGQQPTLWTRGHRGGSCGGILRVGAASH